jgi:hypothetical protein
MGDNNTTSINDLPTDPVSGGSISGGSLGGGANISMSVNEINKGPGQVSLDQTTISQIVNGLQQASIAGATMLPSRDIPQTTQNLTHDPHVQANYIPPPSNKDYINDYNEDDNDEIVNNYQRVERVKNSLDSIYDEIQAPLLLSILYFLFQLPIVRKTLGKYIPLLCSNDGNYNINGLLFTCALFGFIYFMLSKTMKMGTI